MRVLIVDDSVAFRAVLRSTLEDEGFTSIDEAANGRDALQRLAADPPDVVLVDLQMPVLDGLDLIPEIKRRAPTTKIGVVTVAGMSLMADAFEVGGDAYFRKEEPLEYVVQWLRGLDDR
ncbi:MAG TPA: response regulator [Actinomycetota bacterium]|nr:response regulator [Actinomycetota bacterium]